MFTVVTLSARTFSPLIMWVMLQLHRGMIVNFKVACETQARTHNTVTFFPGSQLLLIPLSRVKTVAADKHTHALAARDVISSPSMFVLFSLQSGDNPGKHHQEEVLEVKCTTL